MRAINLLVLMGIVPDPAAAFARVPAAAGSATSNDACFARPHATWRMQTKKSQWNMNLPAEVREKIEAILPIITT